MKLPITLIFSAFLLGACTITGDVKNRAERHLSPECLEIFTSSYGYGQFLSNPMANNMGLITPRAVFAIAKEPSGRMVCVYKNNRMGVDYTATYDELERDALLRCDAAKKQYNVNAVCKVFARGLDVVYESDEKTKRAF